MFLMNSGCGSTGGDTAYFETVEISANCEVTTLSSDIAIWEDSDGNDICDKCKVSSDIVEVTIRSQSFENIAMIPSDVRIERVRIDYTPMDSITPSLASRELALGQFVKPDSDYPLNIEVIKGDQKKSFPLYRVREGEIHGNKTYTYSVKLTFSGIETGTNKHQNFSTDLGLAVLDRTTYASESDDFNQDEPTCDPFNINLFPEQTTLNSDVAIWKDTDPNDGICDSYVTGEDDSVPIKIQTKQSFWNSGFAIEKVTIEYNPIDENIPNLDPREIIYDILLEPNDDFDLPIDIITKNQKEDPNQPLSSLRWNEVNYSKTYEYSVDLTFTFRRLATDELYYEFTNLSLSVSDIPDACTWD